MTPTHFGSQRWQGFGLVIARSAQGPEQMATYHCSGHYFSKSADIQQLGQVKCRSSKRLLDRSLLGSLARGEQASDHNQHCSGYGGEGPKGLAKVIQLLRFHRIDLEEVRVNGKLFSRIEQCQLLDRDLHKIEQMQYVRPLSWVDYLHDIGKVDDSELQHLFPYEIPWASLEPRILDLAMNLQYGDLSAVSQAFNRFESVLKKRCANEAKSLRQAANQVFSNSAMKGSESAKEKFVTSVFTLFRNPRAHEELNPTRQEDFRCFVLLNELFLMEANTK